jgi:chitosanase
MPLTSLEIAAAQACVSVFETGSVSDTDRYSTVAVLAGDTGGLSYGKHQVTLGSGNLYFLLQRFCKQSYSADPDVYILSNALEMYSRFIELLQNAGKTYQMQACQDSYFNDAFWNPSQVAMRLFHFQYPLSASVIYDSFVQGSWELCRNLTTNEYGSPTTTLEQRWIKNYVDVRREWLANNSNRVIRPTAYRMDSFLNLIREGNWRLEPPFVVHGVTVTSMTLTESTDTPKPPVHGSVSENYPVLYEGVVNAESYVEKVQTALNSFGFPMPIDGKYGPEVAAAVLKFQRAHGLTADGKVGFITYNALGV